MMKSERKRNTKKISNNKLPQLIISDLRREENHIIIQGQKMSVGEGEIS